MNACRFHSPKLNCTEYSKQVNRNIFIWSIFLIRYNWHIASYYFQVYNMIRYIYTSTLNNNYLEGYMAN